MKFHGLIFCSSDLGQHYRVTGAHRIATVLRKEGMDIEVIDWANAFTLEELQELVRSRISSRTVFFGFSPFFGHWTRNLHNFTKWLKKDYPDIATIIGGNNVMHVPADPKYLDYWVDGYAEKAVIDLIANICQTSSRPLKFDPFTVDRKLIRCHVDYPAWPMNSYITLYEKRDFIQPYEFLTTEISRGCRFKCDFCNFPVLGVKGDYSRCVGDFEHEMRHNYDNWGVTQYNIADETFNDRSEKIEKFIPVIQNLPFRPWFTGFLRADLLITRREQWQLLDDFNLNGSFFGIESLNRPSLRAISKGFDPERIKEGIVEYKNWKTARSPARLSISLIHGLPFETKETLAESYKFWKENWLDQSISCHALDIGPDDEHEAKSQTMVSSFRSNLEKYGIRRMPQEKVILDFDPNALIDAENLLWSEGREVPTHGMNTITSASQMYPWEHDTMNLYEASRIAQDWNLNLCYKSRVNAFNLNAIALSHRDSLYNITDWQRFKVDDEEGRKLAMQNPFVLDYRDKKLNLF